MLSFFGRMLTHIARRLQQRSIPRGVAGASVDTSILDVYRRRRTLGPEELLAELKHTAWTCASINASVCASFPPRLYVTTSDGQPEPRCLTRTLSVDCQRRLRERYVACPAKAVRVEEVIEHPLLELFRQVNPLHNAWDLWELTTLYQEILGSAYWLLSFGTLDQPVEIWPLPAQYVIPRRERDSTQVVDYYEYRRAGQVIRLAPREIVHFRYPDPRDPYCSGMSPLKASVEQVLFASDYQSYKRSLLDNHALPSAVISPATVLGEDERVRLEEQWNQKLRHGGNGKVIVAESGLNVSLLEHSLGDLAALAEYGQTRQDIANAFGVPLSYLSTETNLANLQAAQTQHMQLTVRPRIQRRDEKINEQLIPLFDPTGRLFVASEDPVPANQEQVLKQQEMDLKLGVKTINEVRAERGLPPVSWGERPWLPGNLQQAETM